MTEVKPWEPVSGWYLKTRDDDARWHGNPWKWTGESDYSAVSYMGQGEALEVTLANGQRVIVRALSEERKQARAFDKRVKKAIEANR